MRQNVSEVWFERPAPESALSHQPVALKCLKVREHRVVCEFELRRQLIDRTRRATEDRDDLPARAFEKAPIQLDRFHNSPPDQRF